MSNASLDQSSHFAFMARSQYTASSLSPVFLTAAENRCGGRKNGFVGPVLHQIDGVDIDNQVAARNAQRLSLRYGSA